MIAFSISSKDIHRFHSALVDLSKLNMSIKMGLKDVDKVEACG